MRTVILSDLHIPCQNTEAVNWALGYIAKTKPDNIVIAGDLVDFWEGSRFDKVPKSQESLQEEIELARAFLITLRKAAKNSNIYYTIGNHDDRLRQYVIKNAPILYGMKEITLEYQLHLDDLNIKVIKPAEGSAKWNGCSIMIDGVKIGHFDKVNKHSAMTAKALVEDRGVSVSQGHCHRLGLFFKRLENGQIIFGLETGCLCRLDPTYMDHANWQNGFGEIVDGIPFVHPFKLTP